MRGWGRALIERVGLFEGGGGLNREFTVFYVGNSKLSSD